LLVIPCGDDLEGLAEKAQQLILPLDRERRRHGDEHALDRFAQLHLFEQQPCHNRFARARIICQQKSQARLWQHL
jgi:hypothetical protein